MSIYPKSFYDECGKFGALAASTCRVEGPNGGTPIANVRARALLTRAFSFMYSNAEEPHAIQISPSDFRCFSGAVKPDGNPSCAWLGVKVRADRRPVFIAIAREDMNAATGGEKTQSIARVLREISDI